MTQANHPFSDPIDEMSRGYTSAQILMTANRLGVFPALGKGRKTVDELAGITSKRTPARLTILCDALTSLGLLRKEGEAYRNSDLALEYLLPDSPKSKIAILKHGWHLLRTVGAFIRHTVKTGRPAPEGAPSSGRVEDDADFARAMATWRGPARRKPRNRFSCRERGPCWISAAGRASTPLNSPGGIRNCGSRSWTTPTPWRWRAPMPGRRDVDRDPFHLADALRMTSVEDSISSCFPTSRTVIRMKELQLARMRAGARSGGRLCVKDFLLDPGLDLAALGGGVRGEHARC